MTNFSSFWAARRLALLALPLAGLLARPAQAQVALSFAAPVTYNAGNPSFAQDVVVADVNTDGLPDLVSLNFNTSNTVGVLLGTGAGTFGAATFYSPGANSSPRGVTVADVNNDGLPDLVTANNSSNTLGVLLGKSAASGGGFQPAQQYATEPQTQYPSRPYSVAVADLNGDGLPDLVAANFGTNTLGVLLGKSAASGGGFEPVQIYPTSTGGSLPRDVKVADVNGDGVPDLITALSNTGDIGVLLGKSAASGGGFQPVQTYSLGRGDAYPYSVVVADINADGLPDLVAPLTNYNAVGVLLGKSAANGGGFQPVQTYSTINQQLVDVAVGDLNSDGVLDIVTGSRTNSSVGMGVLLGKSAASGGGFQTINFIAPGGGRVQVADVSGDGRPDLVTGSVAVQLNTTGAPVLDFRARTEGPIGATLTLTGRNLDRVTSVSFNGTAATFTIVNASTITTTVPVGATTGPLTVTSPAPYGTSNAIAFSIVVPPTALTGTVLNLTTTSAFLRGSVSDNGGAATLVESGLVYVRGTGLPTLADIVATRITAGSNAFSTTATGLLPGTTYTVRSYGINSAGLSYGNPVSFTTLTPTSVVSITRADPNPSKVNYGLLRFTVTFAAPVTGVNKDNFGVTTSSNVSYAEVSSVSGAGTTYTVTVAVSYNIGTGTLGLNLKSTTAIVPSVTNPLPFVGEAYTLDSAPPTATLSSAAGSATSTAPIPFTVTFSEPVSGLTASSLSVSNGTVTTALTSVGNAYSFGVTPTASGPVTVSVPANAAQDAAGNGSAAAAPLSVAYTPLTTAPSVTLLSPAAGPVGTSVTISGTNLSGATAVSFNGTAASSFVVNSPTSLTAVVAAGTTTGPVRVTTPGGSASSAIPFVVRAAPITVADAYTTPAGVALTGNVLTNDLGSDLRAILITRPAHGTLALNPDGSFSYQPTTGYVGPDSFLYYACNVGTALVCGDPATVSLSVVGSTAPITVADAYTTPAGVALTGNVLTNDLGSDLRAILITRPAHGTLALNPDGSFNYQPAAGYVGSDSFLYYACNVGAALICGDPATVSITVAPAPNTRVAATPSGAAPAPAAFATSATAKPVATATRGAAAATEATPALALTGYPNPFGDELQLSFSLPTAQAYTLALYDAQGRLVQQLARGQAAAGQAQQLMVPTRSYAAGLYLLRLSTATGTQLLKLIKQ